MCATDQSTSPSAPADLLEAASRYIKELVNTLIVITRTQEVCTVHLQSPRIYLADAVLTIQAELRPKLPSDQMDMTVLQGSNSIQMAGASLLDGLKKLNTH